MKGDTKVEGNETFAVNLFSPTNATIGDAQGIGTLLNDDGSHVVAEIPSGEVMFSGAPELEGETSIGAINELSLALSTNPVRGPLSVQFALPADADVRINVIDAQGRLVDELANGHFSEGRHTLLGTGRTASLAPGMYFVRIQSGGATVVRKLVALR